MDLFGVADLALDILTHLGPSRSADVGAEMPARGLANMEIAGAARTYLSRSKSPKDPNKLMIDKIQSVDSVGRTETHIEIE